ncbi:MAG: hypothetical protein Q8K65_07480 [Alphaproteobacteria bacterium]|nr:hypothetical protein [Alphaproteobacteria bacterium]
MSQEEITPSGDAALRRIEDRIFSDPAALTGYMSAAMKDTKADAQGKIELPAKPLSHLFNILGKPLPQDFPQGEPKGENYKLPRTEARKMLDDLAKQAGFGIVARTRMRFGL